MRYFTIGDAAVLWSAPRRHQTVEFLLARLHRSRLHEVIDARIALGRWAPAPLLAVCPRCGLEYFADTAHIDESVNWEWVQGVAQLRLYRECPNHPARFPVRA